MKRRKLLASAPLAALPGCAVFETCHLSEGEVYEYSNYDAVLTVLKVRNDYLRAEVENDSLKEALEADPMGCDNRYCTYQIRTEYPVYLEFDCADMSVTMKMEEGSYAPET